MVNNIGVLEGPKSYPKTPITDSLNRQAQIVPRTTMPQGNGKMQLPQLSNKKSVFTAGNLSTACAAGSFITASALLISRIIKLIKHK